MSTAFPDDRDDLGDLGDIQVPDDLSSLLGDADAGRVEADRAVVPPDDDAVPDDLSELTAPRARELAVLLTQVADVEALAAACALTELDVAAVPSPVGALAVLRDPSDDSPENAAAAISKVIAGVPLVLVTRAQGHLTAVRYQDGQPQGNVPPGLVLSGAPEALEDLLTGQITVDKLPGAIGTKGIGRLKAMRMLASVARKARKPR